MCTMAALVLTILATLPAGSLLAQEPQIITGLKQPESIAIGPGGKVYVSETGEYEKANDGYISVLEGGKLRRFAACTRMWLKTSGNTRASGLRRSQQPAFLESAAGRL